MEQEFWGGFQKEAFNFAGIKKTVQETGKALRTNALPMAKHHANAGLDYAKANKGVVGAVAGAGAAGAGAGYLAGRKKQASPVHYLANVAGSTFDTAKKSNKSKAEASGHRIGDIEASKKKNFGEYLFNPAVAGPLSEVGHRLMRRHKASESEHPLRSNLIPAYGMIRGGKAGEKEMKKKASPKDLIEAAGAWGKNHPNAVKAIAAGAGTLALGRAIGSTTDAGKASSKADAEYSGRGVANAKNLREKHTAHYLLNPNTPGPLKEIQSRLSRRNSASAAEHPLRTALIPGYGLIRGGKAGEAEMKKKASVYSMLLSK